MNYLQWIKELPFWYTGLLVIHTGLENTYLTD
jgi:hypothetical protein